MGLIEYWNLSTEPDHAVDMVEPHIFGRVFEFGCGIGRLTHALAEKHPECQFWGYDIEPSLLQLARLDAGPNEHYVSSWPTAFDSAFSVLVFQHLPDEVVAETLERAYPAPFRFQFVIGEETAKDSYQRSVDRMLSLCGDYATEVEPDPVYEQWAWVTAT